MSEMSGVKRRPVRDRQLARGQASGSSAERPTRERRNKMSVVNPKGSLSNGVKKARPLTSAKRAALPLRGAERRRRKQTQQRAEGSEADADAEDADESPPAGPVSDAAATRSKRKGKKSAARTETDNNSDMADVEVNEARPETRKSKRREKTDTAKMAVDKTGKTAVDKSAKMAIDSTAGVDTVDTITGTSKTRKSKKNRRFTDASVEDVDKNGPETGDGTPLSFAAERQSPEEEATEGETKKRKRRKNTKSDQGDKDQQGIIYIGHIPHGFYEDEMREYFGQYGKVERVKLSRSKKTGRSKGYGFVEFESSAVAAVAAESMNGYLMFGRILDVQVVEPDKVHPDLFKGTERKFKTVPWRLIDKNRRNRMKTADEIQRVRARLTSAERHRRKRFADLGIEYEFPGYEADQSRDANVDEAPGEAAVLEDVSAA